MNTNFHGVPNGEKGAPPNQGGGAPALLATINGVAIHRNGPVIWWESGLAIDADGSPRAYHPHSATGLDHLANAGRHGNWWGLVTNAKGYPVQQGPDDPAPGYFISTTALEDPGRAEDDPRRYVDAETVPYVVLSPRIKPHLAVGDFALVINRANGRRAAAIIGDVGPVCGIGEGSIALARALQIPSDPRTGGASGGILTVAFVHSRLNPAWPHSLAEINARVAGLVTQNQTCLPAL